MNFSQLIKTLVDYLDLGKRVATTIPGMVLAVVLVLFFVKPHNLWDYRNLAQRAADDQIAQYQKELAAVEADQKTKTTFPDLQKVRAQLKSDQDLWTQITSSYAGVLQQSFYGILLLGLLGFAIGTVLDPINKALFVQLIPEIGARLSKIPGVEYLSGHSILEKSRQKLLAAHSGKPISARLKDKSSKLTAQFYIGRGLITFAEYNDMVSQYYVYTQISVGMIIPVLVLALFGCYAEGLFDWRLAAAAAFVSVLLQRLGLSRYADFHYQVFDLIAGREKAREDQNQQVSKDQVVNLAQAIKKVEVLSTKLEHSVEHSGTHLSARIQRVEEILVRVESAIDRLEEE